MADVITALMQHTHNQQLFCFFQHKHGVLAHEHIARVCLPLNKWQKQLSHLQPLPSNCVQAA